MSLSSFYGSSSAIIHDDCLAKLESIKKLLAEKSTKLIVVSDFDHTLTKFTSLQCHDIVGFSTRYTAEFLDEFRNIFGQPAASLEEWWRISHDLLVEKSGLTRPMLTEILTTDTVEVRDGLEEFVINLRRNHIPLVIVSAGIKDVIAHTLAERNLPVEGDHLFHIDANFMEFDDGCALAAIHPHVPVHSESKHQAHIRAAHMFDFLHDHSSSVVSASAATTTETDQQEDSDDLVIIESEEPAGGVTIAGVSDEPTCACTETNAGREEVVAVILGDRAHDFAIMHDHPWVHTLNIGFALRAGDVAGRLGGVCDVVFVGEDHSLEAVHRLVDELIQVRKNNTPLQEGAARAAEDVGGSHDVVL